MSHFTKLIVGWMVALSVLGCPSTTVTRDEVVNEQLPRPAQIWVYDFVATSADLAAESALVGHQDLFPQPLTEDQIRVGRYLGGEMAAELVLQIQELGMPAQRAVADTKPQINDLMIRGCFLSMHLGDAEKRVWIGIGEGASELRTAVEGFQMTDHGPRKLGSGTADATGSKTPGAAIGAGVLLLTHNPVGLIVSSTMKWHGEETGSAKVEGRGKQTIKEIADILKKRFQDEGWIPNR